MWYPFNYDPNRTGIEEDLPCQPCEPLENGCKETWCRICEQTRFHFHMDRWVEIEDTR